MGKHLRIAGITLMLGALFLIAVRYLLPIVLPFALGTGLAVCAEPLTGVLTRRLRLPRGVGAALGVSAALCFLGLVLLLLGALLVREVGILTRVAPDLEQTVKTGLSAIVRWLVGIALHLPGGIGTYLAESIETFFSGGTALLDKALAFFLSLAGGILRQVPDGALGVGTAMISAYMIAAKLPEIREKFRQFSEKTGANRLAPALGRARKALGGWLLAQLKLSAITFAVVMVGFAVLGISFAPIWAAVVAIVDALPILGTGTVLVPWSIVCFLQGNAAEGIGLLGIYAIVALLRSMLEPKIVGKQLGIDPLVTLFSLYAGYRVWGFGGMILAPMIAAAVAAGWRSAQWQ